MKPAFAARRRAGPKARAKRGADIETRAYELSRRASGLPPVKAVQAIRLETQSAQLHEKAGNYRAAAMGWASIRESALRNLGSPGFALARRADEKAIRANVFDFCEMAFVKKSRGGADSSEAILAIGLNRSHLGKQHSAYIEVLDGKRTFASFLGEFYPEARKKYGPALKKVAESSGGSYWFGKYKGRLV